MIRLQAVLAGAVCAALTLASCGGKDQGAAAPVVPPIRSANCSDWAAASEKERAVLLTNLYAFYSGQITGSGTTPAGKGPTITAAEATRVLDNYCSQSFAKAFKLYKLYGRASAFNPAGAGG